MFTGGTHLPNLRFTNENWGALWGPCNNAGKTAVPEKDVDMTASSEYSNEKEK